MVNNIVKKIYLVGGYVRDKLLNIKYNDKDYVAVGYSKEDFKDLECVGKDFPVFINKFGQEIALARIERKISKGYNGFEVNSENVTLKEDLKRRDLTINSIAYDEELDKYIDPYGGIKDLKNGILRHTSSAFVEDPLRVLRIARFQAKFPDFIIFKDTKDLIKGMVEELKYLEPNRVYQEVLKVFELNNSEIFFITLYELDVLNIIFPSIYNQNRYLFDIKMMLLKELNNSSNLLKFTALYCDIDNIDLIDISLSKTIKNNILLLINNNTKIANLKDIKIDEIALLFESYRKNKELFLSQLTFTNVYLKITKENKTLDDKMLLLIFDKISNYSPFKWIKENNIKDGKLIKSHIHKVNQEIIGKLFNNHIL